MVYHRRAPSSARLLGLVRARGRWRFTLVELFGWSDGFGEPLWGAPGGRPAGVSLPWQRFHEISYLRQSGARFEVVCRIRKKSYARAKPCRRRGFPRCCRTQSCWSWAFAAAACGRREFSARFFFCVFAFSRRRLRRELFLALRITARGTFFWLLSWLSALQEPFLF